MKKPLFFTSILSAGALLFLLPSCDSKSTTGPTQTKAAPFNHPDGMEGAKALLAELLKTPDKAPELSYKLEPDEADYATVFKGNYAQKAEAVYSQAYGEGGIVVAAKDGQTEIKIWSATSADLKAWNEKANDFPGGYKDVAAKLNDGITIYRFKFVKPGEELGMAYDGLIYVNGSWRLFPKPWKIGK